MKVVKNEADKNNYILLTSLIITAVIISAIVAIRKIELIGITATANIVIYPFTYLLVTYFKEKYGDKKTFKLLNILVICMLVAILLIAFSSILPDYNTNVLNELYKSSTQVLLATITAFYFSQTINLLIYNYLKYEESIKFLLSSTIAVTLDSLVFAIIYGINILSFAEIFKLFTGQYIFNAFSLLFYSFIFSLLIKNHRANKIKEERKSKKTKTKKAQS